MSISKVLVVLVSQFVIGFSVYASEFVGLESNDLKLAKSGASCSLSDSKDDLIAFSDGSNMFVKFNNTESVLLIAVDPFFSEQKTNVYQYIGEYKTKTIIVEIKKSIKNQWEISTGGTVDGGIEKTSKLNLTKSCGS